MEPYAICCTTCRARLKVRDAAAIGQIIACPRCGGMVQVTPPSPEPSGSGAAAAGGLGLAGQSPSKSAANVDLASLDALYGDLDHILGSGIGQRGPAAKGQGGGPEKVPASRQTSAKPAATQTPKASPTQIPKSSPETSAASARAAAPTTPTRATPTPASIAAPTMPAAVPMPAAVSPAVASKPLAAQAPSNVSPPDIPPSPALETQTPVPDLAEEIARPLAPGDSWSSPGLQLARQYGLVGAAGLAGVLLAAVMFLWLLSGDKRPANELAGGSSASGEQSVEEAKAGDANDHATETADDNDAATAANDGGQESHQVSRFPLPETDDTPIAPRGDETPANDAAVEAPRPADDDRVAQNRADDDPPPANADVADNNTNTAGEPERAIDPDLARLFPGGPTPDPTIDDPFGRRFAPFLQDVPEPPAAAGNDSVASNDAGDHEDNERADDNPHASIPSEALSVVRPEPRHVDVPARLGDPLAAIEFKQTRLIDFLRFVSQMSTIPITLDTTALPLGRTDPLSPVAVQLGQTTVGEAATAALKTRGLAFRIENDQLVVGRPGVLENQLRTLRYDVGDLVTEETTIDDLAELMAAVVAPDSWPAAGAEANDTKPHWRLEGNVIAAHQTEAAHYEAVVLWEKLRIARGLPIRSRLDAKLFRLDSRAHLAQSVLAKPVTLNYVQPVLLTKLVQRLEQATGATILIDWRELAPLGWTPDTEVSLVAADEPLETVLQRIAGPRGLAVRVIDEQTLELTGRETFKRQCEIEFHRVATNAAGVEGEREAAPAAGSELLAQIQSQFDFDTLRQRGGDPALAFDPVSRTVIARLPQAWQAQLGEMITE